MEVGLSLPQLNLVSVLASSLKIGSFKFLILGEKRIVKWIKFCSVPFPFQSGYFVNRTFLQSQTELLRAQLDEVGCEVSSPPASRSPPEHNPGLSEHKESGGGGGGG